MVDNPINLVLKRAMPEAFRETDALLGETYYANKKRSDPGCTASCVLEKGSDDVDEPMSPSSRARAG